MAQVIDGATQKEFPHTPLSLYVSLSRGTLVPHELWLSAHFRWKFFLRGLIMPLLTYRILKMLTQHPHYEQLLLTQPRLPCRIHRPYLSNQMSRAEGVNALQYHYEKMTKFLSADNFAQHLSASGINIAQVEGKDGELYYLKLLSTHKLDREGETTIIFRDQAGCMLAEISFTLCHRQGKSALIIGGLQGPKSEDALERIQKATKNFYGLFPKRIVLEALLCLAQLMRTERIHAVATESHVYCSLRYTNRKKHMHADYNALWEMSGGFKTADGYYQLPRATTRKALEEIPSKKRAEYRRRFALLDEIQAQIVQALARW